LWIFGEESGPGCLQPLFFLNVKKNKGAKNINLKKEKVEQKSREARTVAGKLQQ
jgi:hypothetical protein